MPTEPQGSRLMTGPPKTRATGPPAGDRYKWTALLYSASFLSLMVLPTNFSYWTLAVLIAVNGIASGIFASPNSSSIMGSVPAHVRGAASDMRATFQNSGTADSIGVFFPLMIAGLAGSLPHTLTHGLRQQGVPAHIAAQLGVNPMGQLLQPSGAPAP
jgi:hypothetical protein